MKVGLIVKSFGYQYIVEVEGQTFSAVTKAKKTEYVVGDLVEINIINQSQAQITALIKRDNLVYRNAETKSKIIASNVTKLLIVIAVKPSFNPNFLNSCLIFAKSSEIEPLIVINKTDLAESLEFVEKITKLYHDDLGYAVVAISANESCLELFDILQDGQNLLIGQSGVGKSTITAKLTSNQSVRVGELAKGEKSGAHTTTNATLYHINATTTLIDCPGLDEFGLYHLKADQLSEYFPEIQKLEKPCKFRNCHHLNEPKCSVIEAYKEGKIDRNRFMLLQSLMEQLLRPKKY